MLITHAHADHIGDAAAVAKKTDAQLIAMPELGEQMIKPKDFPAKQFGLSSIECLPPLAEPR